MRRLAYTFARFVGLAVLLYGAFVFLSNLVAKLGGATYDNLWALYLVLGWAGIGAAEAILICSASTARSATERRPEDYSAGSGC